MLYSMLVADGKEDDGNGNGDDNADDEDNGNGDGNEGECGEVWG